MARVLRWLGASLLVVLLIGATTFAEETCSEDGGDTCSEPPKEEGGAAEGGDSFEGTDVQVLDDGNFDDFDDSNEKFFTMFFAPWCGHCKNFKPLFIRAAAEMKDEVPFSAIDCTAGGKVLCEEFEVKSFPTIKYFADGEDETYDGPRTQKDVVKFLKRKTDPEWEPEVTAYENEENPDWEESGKVFHVTDDHFDWFREEHPRSLIFFYAPWCGHCKAAKPEFAMASKRIGNALPFVAVDCTVATETCRGFGVNSYPSLYSVDGENQTEIPTKSQARDNGYFITLANKIIKEAAELEAKAASESDELDLTKLKTRVLKQMLRDRGLECEGCTDKSEVLAMLQENIDKPIIDNAAEKSSKPKPKVGMMEARRIKQATENAEYGWQDEPEGDGLVVHVTDQTIHETVLNENTVLFFYAPWCEHCTMFKDHYALASVELEFEEIQLAAIDCDENKRFCKEQDVSGYPMIRFFKKGTTDLYHDYDPFNEVRDKSGVIKFVNNNLHPAYNDFFKAMGEED